MCVSVWVIKKFENSWMLIMTCYIYCTAARFCSILPSYCPILYDVGQIRLILPDIVTYSLYQRKVLDIFIYWHSWKNLEIDDCIDYLQIFCTDVCHITLLGVKAPQEHAYLKNIYNNCYSLSYTCFLKLTASCKNLIPFAPIVWLALVLFIWEIKKISQAHVTIQTKSHQYMTRLPSQQILQTQIKSKKNSNHWIDG